MKEKVKCLGCGKEVETEEGWLPRGWLGAINSFTEYPIHGVGWCQECRPDWLFKRKKKSKEGLKDDRGRG